MSTYTHIPGIIKVAIASLSEMGEYWKGIASDPGKIVRDIPVAAGDAVRNVTGRDLVSKEDRISLGDRFGEGLVFQHDELKAQYPKRYERLQDAHRRMNRAERFGTEDTIRKARRQLAESEREWDEFTKRRDKIRKKEDIWDQAMKDQFGGSSRGYGKTPGGGYEPRTPY
jgi:hypothetical protein